MLTLSALSFYSFAASNCPDKEYRQFDFWLGQWQVTAPNSKNVSHSKISLINDGCGILEEYSTPTGFIGKSLNIYNKQTKQWHQSWTDNTGLLLLLNGDFIDDKMVLEGNTVDKDGNTVLNRISWSVNGDHTVRQHWQISTDKDKLWQTLFDGTYTKVNP